MSNSVQLASAEECSICWDGIGSTNRCVTQCGHIFCFKCIASCLGRNSFSPCPMCRAPLNGTPEPVDGEAEGDDDEEDEDFDLESDEDDEAERGFWMHTEENWDRLLRLQNDARSQDYSKNATQFFPEYCAEYSYRKYAIRCGVLESLGCLKDEEWKLAESEILKTVAKYYGRVSEANWEEGEMLGLANSVLFANA